MAEKLRKPRRNFLKSYFIVSSNINRNVHKMISYYVTDLVNITVRRNIKYY